MERAFRPVALVPAYQAQATVGDVVRGLAASVAADAGRRRRIDRRDGRRGRGAPARRSCACRKRRQGSALRAGLARVARLRRDARRVRRRRRPARSGGPAARCSTAARAGDDFVIGSRMARSRRDSGVPLPDQRDRQPDPVADDGARGRGRPVRLPRRRGRRAAPARSERARILIETEILLKAAPPRAALPPRPGPRRSTAAPRTTGRSGTPGSSRGARCTTRCSRWTEAPPEPSALSPVRGERVLFVPLPAGEGRGEAGALDPTYNRSPCPHRSSRRCAPPAARRASSRSTPRTGSTSAATGTTRIRGAGTDSPRASRRLSCRCSTVSARGGHRATVFFLGWIARRHPESRRESRAARPRDRRSRRPPSSAPTR